MCGGTSTLTGTEGPAAEKGGKAGLERENRKLGPPLGMLDRYPSPHSLLRSFDATNHGTMSQPPVNFEMYLQDEWYLLNPATTFLLDDVDTAPAPSYLQDPGFGDMSYATDSLIDNTLPDWAPIGGQQDVAGLGLAA